MADTVRAEAGFALEHQNKQLDDLRHRQLLEKQKELLSAVSESSGRHKPAVRPKKFNIPYSKNSSFHGRLDQLLKVHEYLRPDAPDANETQKVAAVCGLGGVGKTQIALEYAYKYRHSYQACFWITCDSTVKIAQGYAEIARILGYSEIGDAHDQINVKEWFCSTGGFRSKDDLMSEKY
jgi:hypothetical protein